jgi:glycosyltransferase involved in cell wall biosynthesis
MKNIWVFNDSLHYGGTEVLLVNILYRMCAEHGRLSLLLPAPNEKNVLLKNISPKVNIKYIYSQRLSGLKRVLHENLMAFSPSLYLKVVNINLKPYDLLLCFKDSQYSIIFTGSKLPKILWIHNLPVKRNFRANSFREYFSVKLLKARLNKYICSFRRYNEVIFVSNAAKNNYINIYNSGKPASGQKLRVLYNAIDFSRINELCKETYPPIGQDSRPAFVMATRFSVEKRIDRVIDAAKKLKDEGYVFKVFILGDGVFFNAMKQRIAEQSLNDDILLLGYVANPYPYIKSGDWLICSSEKESFSLVIIESIYLGTPVITTDCGGPAEISANGKYALLTENSGYGVYRGMKKALDNPSLSNGYTSLSDECLQRFNYHKWLEEVEQILMNDKW